MHLFIGTMTTGLAIMLSTQFLDKAHSKITGRLPALEIASK